MYLDSTQSFQNGFIVIPISLKKKSPPRPPGYRSGVGGYTGPPDYCPTRLTYKRLAIFILFLAGGSVGTPIVTQKCIHQSVRRGFGIAGISASSLSMLLGIYGCIRRRRKSDILYTLFYTLATAANIGASIFSEVKCASSRP